MRTTLDLPDDLHRIALSLAHHSGRSLGQTVGELMRRGLDVAATRVTEPQTFYRVDPDTGLPLVRAPRPITDEDVKALDDDS